MGRYIIEKTRKKRQKYQPIKYISITFAFLFLFSICLLSLIPQPASAITSDVNYTFDASQPYDNLTYQDYNLRHNNELLEERFNGSYNFDYETELGYYYGSYSFRNEVEGSNPQYYYEIDEAVSILSEVGGHKDVLSIRSESAGDFAYYRYQYDGASSDIIEFWIYPNGTLDDYFYIYLQPLGVQMRKQAGTSFKYYNGTDWVTIGAYFSADT